MNIQGKHWPAAQDLKAEADHRIANNLASLSGLIRIQCKSVAGSEKTYTSDQVCLLLSDISARIEATARLHKFLAFAVDGQGINLGDFLSEICDMVRTLAPEGKLDLALDKGPTGFIEPRLAFHTGLIATELLTNAIKYAHPSGVVVKVRMRCEADDKGAFMLEVADDGVGLPEQFDPATDGGLGFQLMRAFADGLQAELTFENDGVGFCARLCKQATGTGAAAENKLSY
jgi:two-component sensor histidine kinase